MDSPRSDTNLPSWTLSNTGRNDISEVQFLNLVCRETGFLDGMLDSGCAELRGGQAGERSSHGSDRCSGGREDVDWVFT